MNPTTNSTSLKHQWEMAKWADVCTKTDQKGRQIEARQICRLPQLQLPVVHAIGWPQVAVVLWL